MSCLLSNPLLNTSLLEKLLVLILKTQSELISYTSKMKYSWAIIN